MRVGQIELAQSRKTEPQAHYASDRPPAHGGLNVLSLRAVVLARHNGMQLITRRPEGSDTPSRFITSSEECKRY